jgi:hypothetical protein
MNHTIHTVLSILPAVLLLTTACSAPAAPTNDAFGDQAVGDTLPDTPVDTGEPDGSADDAGPDGSGEVDATCGSHPAPEGATWLPKLDGTWVQFNQTSSCVKFTSYDEQFNKSLYLVTSTQDEHGSLVEQWENCGIELSPVYRIQPTPSQGTVNALKFTTRGGLVDGTRRVRRGTDFRFLPGAKGDGYASGAFVELWGMSFENPLTDPFPSSADQVTVVDTDGDGLPAASLSFTGGCVAYVAQRAISYFDGRFVEPDRIEGSVVSVTRQIIVDATQPLCKSQYDIWSNRDRSRFARVRIDGQGGARNFDANADGRITCDEVVGRRDELFDSITPTGSCCDPAKLSDPCCQVEAQVCDPACQD